MRPRISPLDISKERSLTATRPPNCLRAARASSMRSPGVGRSRCGQCRRRLRRLHPARRREPALKNGMTPSRARCSSSTSRIPEHDRLELAGLADDLRQQVLQPLLEYREQPGADHRAPHEARAADHHHEQVLDPGVDRERRRIHEPQQVRVEPARQAGEQRGVDEDDDLDPGGVDAEALGHHAAAAQAADRAARARVEQVLNRAAAPRSRAPRSGSRTCGRCRAAGRRA